jgi:hypothetical protein
MAEACAHLTDNRNHKLLHSMTISNLLQEALNLFYILLVIFIFTLVIKMLNWLPLIIQY